MDVGYSGTPCICGRDFMMDRFVFEVDIFPSKSRNRSLCPRYFISRSRNRKSRFVIYHKKYNVQIIYTRQTVATRKIQGGIGYGNRSKSIDCYLFFLTLFPLALLALLLLLLLSLSADYFSYLRVQGLSA